MKNLTTILCIMVASFFLLFSLNVPEGAAAEESTLRTLKFTTLYSKGKRLYKAVEYFTGEIEKRTNGNIKFNIFPGSSLVPSKKFASSVHNGVVDLAFVPPAYEQGMWPLTSMTVAFGAPNITYDDWGIYHDRVREIMNKTIDLNVVILSMPHIVSYHLGSSKPLTGKVSDFEGLLVRGAGGAQNKSLEALGSRVVMIPAPETYMALQRGTIDASVNPFERYVEGKVYEVAPYYMVIPKGFASAAQYFIINKNIWNKLPADTQKIFLQVGTELVSFTCDMLATSDKKIFKETFPKLNIKSVIMSETENKFLLKKVGKVWDPIINELGKPAEEIARIIGIR